ncbi:redoxin domain-containing protein [Flavihumibacter petaseus]|uniref:Putative thioredoxin n=1 Tax=Flavihumibacter petaseus NBRC 106054 TaxID=1220578 RepID=A0A0E9N6U9_9BACT|nr:redoxin domain-containing protein [Flavihumibacter petaseus]GAO45528.1 putative thioredoxin [Flavihumibacter petaseus NBRC 106054]
MKTLLALLFFVSVSVFAGDPVTLAIGSKAPEFSLPGIDGKTWTLANFSDAKVLVIVFTCNHCPTAQAYEDRLIQLTADYAGKGVAVVAINPNDPAAISLSELDYTDLSDSFEEMKLRAATKHFNFPYLYDGAAQTVARAYGPVATPHVFIFDKERMLRFQGRIDNMEKPSKTPTIRDARNAIESLLSQQAVAVPTTKVFGCSIKWASKENWIDKAKEEWAKEPVNLSMISEPELRNLLKNDTKKLRLINVWATWCGPCVKEYPDFITIKRMYKSRNLEFISISADDPANKEKVLEFLKTQQSSNANYLFNTDDKYQLIEAIDPNWQGALPYTILVEPGGKIVYAKQGPIDAAAMKTLIVEHPLIGRYF